MIDLNSLRAYLEKRLPFYLDLLRQMVEINSFTANVAGVDRLGQVTAQMFADLGFAARHVASKNPAFGSHLVLQRGDSNDCRIGMVSHLDTVFPKSEEKENNFHWREQGDLIYGPGTVDIKGGTLIMYMMLDALRHARPDVYDRVDWRLLFDSAEEVDGEEFGELCLQQLAGPQTLACLIFEGGMMRKRAARVVVARKGMAVFRLTAEGRAAHAGTSHGEGANAIVQLAEAVRQIAGWTDYERELTVNVGTIAGGTVVNRVPHFASSTVEMRAFGKEVFEEGLARMLALPDSAAVVSADEGYQCRLQVEIIKQTRPWAPNEGTQRLFEIWREAGAELGVKVLPEERGGLSDGNYFWDVIPCLDGLGASGGNAHCSERSADGLKDQEFARRSTFVPKALLNVSAVFKLLQQEGGQGAPAPGDVSG